MSAGSNGAAAAADRGFALAGRTVLVTGASRGIGAETAKLLAARGGRVVCAARTVNDGDHALEGSLRTVVAEIRAAGGEAVAVPVDLASDESCARLVEQAIAAYGPVEVLVNNAAVGFFGPLIDLSVSRWMASWRVTCHAPFLLSKLVLPGMIARGEGRIVNVSSNSAIGPGRPPYPPGGPAGDTAYGSQKASIERFTQGLAEELLPHGVGVAAVAPSQIVPTPGAMMNEHADGVELEPMWHMPEAIHALVTGDLEATTGRVVYSQQLLLELGLIESGAGLGVDAGTIVTGYAQR